MWTKLANLSFAEAFVPTIVNGKWRGAAVSARYRAMLRKEFAKAGVPWNWDLPKSAGPHPFDRAPKFSRHVRNKPFRVEKIKAALAKQEDMILKHRQETLNKKRPAGIDLIYASALGNFVKGK